MSIIKDAPEEIYLVIEGVEPGDTFKDCHDVTWEAEQINDNDVKYIRADKLAALEADAARLREAMLDAVEKLNASEPALNGDGWTLAPIRNEMLSALGETK